MICPAAGAAHRQRGDTTRFLAFANTVAARSYSRHDEAPLDGARFFKPRRKPSRRNHHPRPMLDKENVQEQEIARHHGVNLIYAACCYPYRSGNGHRQFNG